MVFFGGGLFSFSSSILILSNVTHEHKTILLLEAARTKQLKHGVYRVLYDLSVLASGLVGDRTLGSASCTISPTRPEARTDKSDRTLGPIL